MKYRLIDRAPPETFQNNRWNSDGRYSGPDFGPRRGAPAEKPYRQQRRGRWYEGRREIKGFKAPMFIVRPSDGKRSGTIGRLLDALTGEGPDVFVIKCGDKRTLMRDRPQRWQWSGWGLDDVELADLAEFDKDFRPKDLRPIRNWLQSIERARAARHRYNFQSRRYHTDRETFAVPPEYVWRDVRWPEDAKRWEAFPLSFLDGNREWWTRVPRASGNYAGGRPRNFREMF